MKVKVFFVVSIAIPLLFLFPILLHSATFIVDSAADTVDASLGDGVCADGSGSCTLRAAILETNALTGADIIDLPAGTYILNIVGRNEDASFIGDLDITDDLTINGAAESTTLIDGNGIDRALHIIGSIAELSDLTLVNGDLPSGFGGGGGVLNEGTATFTNCTITGSRSSDQTGGLQNVGTATLTNCTISNNDGGDDAGGIVNFGTVTLIDSTISGNVSSGFGDAAGILNMDTATLINCTISNNDGGEGFGGIENAPGAIATLTNCTIGSNVAQLSGGGLLNDGTATLTNCTISNNEAGEGGGIWNTGTVKLKNSIVANNTSGGDCFGEITSLDNNLDSDGTCNLTEPNDLPNTDPLLGEFTDDEVPGRGHFPLLEGSLAIDSGDDDCPLTDQLGNPRVDGDGDSFIVCDIGAVEFLPPYIEVEIDIKPGSYPNSIYLRSAGVIPVAILTTEDFDATTVDPLTVVFGPGGAMEFHEKGHIEDVDEDGDLDLALHFKNRETGIECDDIEVLLAGETYDGQDFIGSDNISTIGCE